MPGMYFRYGAMNAGKTVHLLVALHQYKETGKKAILIKPKCDTRNGVSVVWSRVSGLSRDADIVLPQKRLLNHVEVNQCLEADCIFVDESQFLHPSQVEQLSHISLTVPVICYGLRTLSNGKLWPGSAALFACADHIEEIKNICKYCKHRSTQNLQVVKQLSTSGGISLGTEEVFVGTCKRCFYEKSPDPFVNSFKIYTNVDPVIVDE